MSGKPWPTLRAVELEIGPEAVVVTARAPLTVLSSAVVGGALVNAALTVAEAKALVLFEHEVRTPTGAPATGTSTDAIVIAITDEGPPHPYGGPASLFGALVAKVARHAIGHGVRDWLLSR